MVKRYGGSRPSSIAPPADPIPHPPADLAKVVMTVIWPQGEVIHRIHLDQYASEQFNPGLQGNARFSPIKNAAGKSVPTLYGGTSFDCAIMETVFHDVPFAPGLKTYDKQKLAGQVYSQLVPSRDLVLAELTSTALRKLGIQRNQLIDTEKDRYSDTRAWAAAIHAQCPEVEGLYWVSRQDDRARAVVLFGDRLSASALAGRAASLPLVTDITSYSNLLALADRIGVLVVDATP